MKYYWWSEHTNEQIRLFITATNDEHRRNVFNNLIPTLNTMILICLKEYKLMSKEYKEDYNQDILMHLFTYTLHKITVDKVITSQEYIYVSICNYIKSNILNKKDIIVYGDYIFSHQDINYSDDDMNLKDMRIDILAEIDSKIREQEIINKRNSIFLLLLKEYLIVNHFDVREFSSYCMKRMDITYPVYISIAFRLGIKTKLLNEKYINKKYKGEGSANI